MLIVTVVRNEYYNDLSLVPDLSSGAACHFLSLIPLSGYMGAAQGQGLSSMCVQFSAELGARGG